MTTTKVNLANTVEGILPVANGGTGTSTGVAPGGSTTQVQYNNAGAFGGDSGFVYTGGNVGIGTSSPAQKLDVSGGSIRLTSGASTADFLLVDTGTTSGNVRLRSQSNAMQFITGGGVSATIDSSGNVLVGTTTALQSGSNRGNITIGGSASSILNLGTGATTQSYLFHTQTGNELYLVNAANGPAIFYTNNAERMRITSGGNLLLGLTTGAVTQFTMSGDLSHRDNASGIFNISNYENAALTFSTNTSGSGGERMRITSAGNVGIGTSSPASLLTVNGDARIQNGGVLFYDDTNVYTGRTSNSYFVVTGATERMRIASTGALGFSGANYGSSGQVLTSNGSGSAPSWGAVSGTAKAYGFINSSSGSSVLSNSFNVSSVTLTSSGQNTINWATAFANAQYVIVATTNKGDSNNDMNAIVQTGVTGGSRQQSTTQAFLSNGYSNQFQNSQQVCFVVFSN